MKKITSLGVLLCVLCWNLAAQVTTSGLNGQIVDQATNAPLAGATILVTHVPTASQSYAMTDESGYLIFFKSNVDGVQSICSVRRSGRIRERNVFDLYFIHFSHLRFEAPS